MGREREINRALRFWDAQKQDVERITRDGEAIAWKHSSDTVEVRITKSQMETMIARNPLMQRLMGRKR